ncbi:undecaprenyl/decaprenyl-phosphate alpha-N-acetylglucosaminyl 1-phosphate transferase [candidate division WWE3 bacterium]|uniref:Undecaprenyl/decaprenyl-phosphate alpha-N-acetylglucosaminyl 1-phosphate transferase n=1 Tax=candidate division WWE3 bacterium TaxID=2053526 RepID=A0A955LJH5_UNCKA|nr:undecaprenyl/decaprenyl-phosphate alpha-N-acetylglucosaminyl 1-phosphate transferase [candidate division WWE3 bacterium]
MGSQTLYTLLIAFVVAFGVSYALTPIVRKLAVRFGFVDNPTRKHPAILHSTVIPRAGGVAMFIAFVIAALLFASIDKLLFGIIIGGAINVVVGTLDDKYDLPPALRLLFQVLSAVVVGIAGVTFYVSNPFQEGLLYFGAFNLIILIVWIVWLMNTINWTKGASQLPGVAVIAYIALAVTALNYQSGNPYQIQTAILSVISAGVVLAFLPYNFPPERMFPGFGASTFIGFNLAVLSVLSGGKVATLLIVLAIPIVDAILVGLKRILSGKSPLRNDRGHLYHFLLDLGWSKQKIIFLYWGAGIVLGVISVMQHTEQKITSLVILVTIISLSFVYLYMRKANS